MKAFRISRPHILGTILAGLLMTLALSGCYDDGYGYGYGGGYYDQSTYVASSGDYYYDPAYAQNYRSVVYESPAPYYRTSPRYYYSGSYISGGGGRYYGNEYRHHHNENRNDYRRSSTYRRDTRSSKSPSEQRNEFKIDARSENRYGDRAKQSLERDKDREKSAEKKRR